MKQGLEQNEEIQLPYGKIIVKDWMGGDQAIVQAARVSYQEGTKTFREDRALIRYLMRKRHTSPFEQCELKLLIRCPMDVWRQWIRHRTASVNEYSTRYSIAINQALTTSPEEWRLQSLGNKQGSSEENLSLEQAELLSLEERNLHRLSREVYEKRLVQGVAREQARKDLPLSTFTEAYWKIDLHNLLHFLELRMDPHAQLEIRAFAVEIGKLVERWCPITWEAFNDYRLRALTFSQQELHILGLLMEGMKWTSSTFSQKEKDLLPSERERGEFWEKVSLLRSLASKPEL